MKKKLIVGLAAAALAIVPMGAAFGASHDGTGEVVIVHGVPDLEVDILVNGETSDFTGLNFGDSTQVDLPAGTYELGVAATGSTDPILEATAEVEAGMSYSVVAYLQEGGEPTLGLFVNENDAPGIQPFHTADFGAVSIIAGGEIALDDVTNGTTARIDATGTVPGVGIGVAGSSDAAIDLGDVEVGDDNLVLAYAVGPDTDAELPSVITEVVSVHTAATPDTIESGTGGLLSNSMPAALIALMMLGAVAIAVPAVATARRNS